MVMPGDNITVTVELINPIAIEEGTRFAIREGGRTVGAGAVATIQKIIISIIIEETLIVIGRWVFIFSQMPKISLAFFSNFI